MDPATIFLVIVCVVGGGILIHASCVINRSRRHTLDLYREAARADLEFRSALLAYLLSKPTGAGGHDETDQDPSTAGPASATGPGRPSVPVRQDDVEQLMSVMSIQPEFRDLSGDELREIALKACLRVIEEDGHA